MLLVRLNNNRRRGFIKKTPIYFQKNYNKIPFKMTSSLSVNDGNISSIKLISSQIHSFLNKRNTKKKLSVICDSESIHLRTFTQGIDTYRTDTSVNKKILKNNGLNNSIRTLFYKIPSQYISTVYNYFNGRKILSTAPGNYIKILLLDKNTSTILCKLPSGGKKKIPILNIIVLGRSSGIFNKFTFNLYSKLNLKKKKLSVRGIAKNPNDHPNGGRSNTKQPFMNIYNNIARNNK